MAQSHFVLEGVSPHNQHPRNCGQENHPKWVGKETVRRWSGTPNGWGRGNDPAAGSPTAAFGLVDFGLVDFL